MNGWDLFPINRLGTSVVFYEDEDDFKELEDSLEFPKAKRFRLGELSTGDLLEEYKRRADAIVRARKGNFEFFAEHTEEFPKLVVSLDWENSDHFEIERCLRLSVSSHTCVILYARKLPINISSLFDSKVELTSNQTAQLLDLQKRMKRSLYA